MDDRPPTADPRTGEKRPGTEPIPMRVADWMKLPTHVVKPRDTVAHARALLEEHRINQLPVAVNGKLVGIVTDRDLRDAPRALELSAAAAKGRREGARPRASGIPVEAVMSEGVLTIGPDAGLEEAASLMRRQRVGALPVVSNGRLVGILTRSDILDAFATLAARYLGRAEP